MELSEQHMAVENDQYQKINELSAKVEQLAGVVSMANKINGDLVSLLKKALLYMFLIIVCLIGAIIYGAIGKDGFYAVRQGVVPIGHADAIPWGDDKKASGGTVQPE